MFAIYRESIYSQRYRVVYFTELHDSNRDVEINRALAGEPFFDGFIKNVRKEEAKQVIQRALDRLNNGEAVDPEELARELAPYTPE